MSKRGLSTHIATFASHLKMSLLKDLKPVKNKVPEDDPTPWLMEPGGSRPHSQGLSNNLYLEPN